MREDTLINLGYRVFNKESDEPTLYQKKVCDNKGIKYFINCYHYIFPYTEPRDNWEFKLQTESTLGTVNTALFNSSSDIKEIEEFMEGIWLENGAKYYKLFALSEQKEVNSQQCKKGEGVPLHNSLEPRSKTGEDKKTVMPVDADNHSADNTLSENSEVKK